MNKAVVLGYSIFSLPRQRAQQQQRRVMTKGDVGRGEDEKNDAAM